MLGRLLLVCCWFCHSTALLAVSSVQPCSGPALTLTRSGAALMLAKKSGGGKKGGGGGKKGGKAKKESGFAWASDFELKPFESSELRALAETVANAYQSRTGKPLHASLVSAALRSVAPPCTMRCKASTLRAPCFFVRC